MRRCFLTGIIILQLVCPAYADTPGSLSAEADSLYEDGGMENLSTCVSLYRRILSDAPDSYEAAWKCARACWRYGKKAKARRADGWKKTCARYGKIGMHCAQQAMGLAPGSPEGYYYYGLNAGVYADGVSMFTCLRQGLKGKVQKSLEKVYALDRMYDEGEAMLALGRFWAVVPWPYRDSGKALRYYREYQQTPYFAGKAEAKLYLAELLLKKGAKNRIEAEELLKQVVSSGDKPFSEQAQRLLGDRQELSLN